MNTRLELETWIVQSLFNRLQYNESVACQLAPTCAVRATRQMQVSASALSKGLAQLQLPPGPEFFTAAAHQPRQLRSGIPLIRLHARQAVELPRALVVDAQLLPHGLRQARPAVVLGFQLDRPEEAEGVGVAPLQEHPALIASLMTGVFPVDHDLAHALELLVGDPVVVPAAFAAQAESVF